MSAFVASGRLTMRAARVRRGPAEEMLTPRDLEVLRWLGEQCGGRLDHLEALLGCGERQARRVVARLREHGLVRVERLLVGEPSWVTPTSRGLALAGCEFRVWQPSLALLSHVAAVNGVRLHIQGRSPGSVWVCERELARERGVSGHLPDGVVVLDGRRVAVEVELTLKSRQRIEGILDDLAGSYDTFLYFCAPKPLACLTELAASGRWPGLGLRELPTIVGERL